MPVAETTFGIAYDGPALATGRMPVRDLAPALLALGDLFSLASGVLYPQLAPVSLKVEATAEGSFLVRLLLDAEEGWDQLIDLFGSEEASALTNLTDAVLLAGGGLFWVIKKIGRRKISSADHTLDPGTIRLTLDDHTTLEVPIETWTLFRNVEIRKYTREVVQPLGREGVDVVKLMSGRSDEDLVIEKADLPAFAVTEVAEEPLLEQTQEMYVEIVAVAFIPGNKWRLSLGDYTFWASVDDEQFLERVQSGEEAFRKGDVLRCLMEMVQTRDVDGLHMEYRVLEVREHLPRAGQMIFGGDA